MHHLVLLSALTAALGQYGTRSTCPNGNCSRVQSVQATRPAAPPVYYPMQTPAAASYPVQATAPAPLTYSRGYSRVAAPQPAPYYYAPAPQPAPAYYAPAPAATQYRTSAATCPNGTCSRR